MRYFILILILLSNQNLLSKVDPPNYDFSVDLFIPFMPGKNISEIIKKQKPKIVSKNQKFTTYQFFIEHIRYKFILLVQTSGTIVTDFHARLPQYFLHDVFHQSLINRYGNQDLYKKTDESAVYIWKNKNNTTLTYSGACTITCFPIFYSAVLVKHNYGKLFKSILDKQLAVEY